MSSGDRQKRTKIADWGWDDDGKGPWFIARYSGTLSCCGDDFEEGEEIRADGTGGYEGKCCQEESDSF